MNRFNLTQEMVKKRKEFECIFCHNIKGYRSFYPSASRISVLRIDESGTPRLLICKECCQQFFDYLYKMFRTPQQALYQFCSALDVYYDAELADKGTNGEFSKYLDNYFKLLNSNIQTSNKTFADTILGDKVFAIEPEATEEEEFTEEDERNRREVLALYHYDPFKKDTVKNRKQLYRDLVTMIDPAMADDLVRQRAALEIVRSFARTNAIDEAINKLSEDPQKMMRNSKEIKALTETKNKETDMITKFCKDNGFTERYATAKSRGAGTLTAAIRDMEEFGFDDGKVNRYDIKTSASMQQAADISTQAILKQLSLSEADYVDMLKQQRIRLIELQQELERSQETLRLVYKQITKQEILKELADQLLSKGLEKEEVAIAILNEINYDDKKIKKAKKEIQKEESSDD